MSGHSKWATIKRKKEKTDAGRGKAFTKIGREIAVAVKAGGPNPDMNPRLREVVAKAKANNMPGDTIARSIKKAAGEIGAINYESVQYEGYGPGGVAVLIDALTDNRNRTAADIRHCLTKNGGSLGATGCVGWMFERKGMIEVPTEEVDSDELMMAALDAGASDFTEDEDVYQITTEPNDFTAVLDALTAAGYECETAEMGMYPANTASVSEEQAEQVMAMLDMLEDNDDVQNVYHNME